MEMSRRSPKTPESTLTPGKIPIKPTFARCVLYVAISYQTKGICLQIPSGSLTDTIPAGEMIAEAVEGEEGFGG